MDAWTSIGHAATAAEADEFALVLQAMGIRTAVARVDEGTVDAYELIVPVKDAARARDELTRFVSENRGWLPRPVLAPPLTMGVGAALVYVALLGIAFFAERQGSYGVDWIGAGAADAALIRGGEWWRAVTALSLHGDIVHLGGNLLFGALFGVMLAQSVGSGSTWLIFVLAGGVGNWLNAWWQPPAHLAIGASTGVFALLGAQVACDWMRRGRVRRHAMRRWAPIVMGVAVLAWFGGSGGDAHVDVGAHVFGFGAGLVCGGALGWRTPAAWASPRAQGAFSAAAIGLVALAWALAV